MKYYWRGAGVPHKCIDCKYCDVENMKCRPESKDCAEEYTLDEHDINTEDICDFFVKKECE